MKLSQIDQIYNKPIELIRDCEFDGTYLLGKDIVEKDRKVISFLSSVEFIDQFLQYDITGAICTGEVAEAIKDVYEGGIIVAENPKTAFLMVHNHFAKERISFSKSRISESAIIHSRAIIAEKGVEIGDNTVIHANAVIKEGTRIGDNSEIREGCVIGGPAFYYYGEGDERSLVTSSGTVRIGNNVELHSNVIVEKGVMFGETLIDDNCKLDNGVIIGHDSLIGKNCIIAGNSILAGGVHLGDDSFMGVSAVVSPDVTIGSDCKLSSGAVVTKNVEAGKHVSGNFAIDHRLYIDHIKKISK